MHLSKITLTLFLTLTLSACGSRFEDVFYGDLYDEEPAVEEPAVEEPVVEEPVVEVPVVEVPVVEEPVVEVPVVEVPVVEVPVVEEPVVEEPVVEEPVVEEPVVEVPVVEEPVVEEPVVEVPVVEVPIVEEPVVEEPVVEEPVVEVPVVEEPIVETPVVIEEPIVEEPVVEVPVVEEPIVEVPVVEVPAVEEPVEEDPKVETPVVLEPGAIPAHEETAERVYGVPGKVTYSLYLKGVEPDLAAYISNSMKNAVWYYNTYGDFKKHVVANYHVGVPTAQAGYDGKITFGSQRNTRTAMHELQHTMGIGTHSGFWALMTDGTWDGPLGNAMIADLNNIPGQQVPGEDGNGHILTRFGLNQDWQESEETRIGHVKLVEAMRCDMGAGPCHDWEGENMKIVNRASGLVLDITENANGGNVFVATDNGSASQRWTVANARLGEISFRNSQSGSRAVDTWGGGTVNGTNLKLYGFWGGESQRYIVEPTGDGYFTVKPKIAQDQCMDAYGNTSGRNVGTWACHGGYNQQWKFVAQ